MTEEEKFEYNRMKDEESPLRPFEKSLCYECIKGKEEKDGGCMCEECHYIFADELPTKDTGCDYYKGEDED